MNSKFLTSPLYWKLYKLSGYALHQQLVRKRSVQLDLEIALRRGTECQIHSAWQALRRATMIELQCSVVYLKRIWLRIGLCVLLGAFLIAPAQAATPRYVSATGVDSGNCATSSAPCRTIAYTIEQAKASGLVLRLVEKNALTGVVVPAAGSATS